MAEEHLKILAASLYQQLTRLKDNRQHRAAFMSAIQSNTQALFQSLSSTPTIARSDLVAILGPKPVRVLVQNQKHITAHDLRRYLEEGSSIVDPGFTLREEERNFGIGEMVEFEKLLEKDSEAMEGVRQLWRSIKPEQLFNEIDFFGNGYFDGTSLFEFIQHHFPKDETDTDGLQGLCSQVIKYLKNSTSDKLFYKDFILILEEPTDLIDIQQMPSKFLSRSIGHITKVSDIDFRASRHHSQLQNSKGSEPLVVSSSPKFYIPDVLNSRASPALIHSPLHTYKNSNVSNSQTFLALNDSTPLAPQSNMAEKVKRELQKEALQIPSFEDKLRQSHWRNEKYLQKAKKQQNHDLQLFSKAKARKSPTTVNPENVNEAEVLFQLKYLGQIYHKHSEQVKKLVHSNPQFTMLNGFNVIDSKGIARISLQDLKDFLAESNICIHEPKITVFFNQLALSTSTIKYHNYVNQLFRLASIQSLYATLSERKPLLLDRWPQEQKRNYCRFVRNMISISNEREEAKLRLRRLLGLNSNQEESFICLFGQPCVYPEKMLSLLGEGCETMIQEMKGKESTLTPKIFFSFLGFD